MKYFVLIAAVLLPLGLRAQDFIKTEEIVKSILREAAPASPQAAPDREKEKKEQPPARETARGDGEDSILLKTGIQMFNAGEFTHAEELFNRIITGFPGRPYAESAKMWKARIQINRYNYGDAITLMAQVDRQSGEYPAALYYTAECHETRGGLISAIEFHKKLTLLFPEHELADNSLLKISSLYLKSRNGTHALESAIELIKNYSERETIDDAYYLIGKIFENDPALNDQETAAKIYRIFLARAEAGEIHFADSPLKEKVQKDLKYIQDVYFRFAN